MDAADVAVAVDAGDAAVAPDAVAAPDAAAVAAAVAVAVGAAAVFPGVAADPGARRQQFTFQKSKCGAGAIRPFVYSTQSIRHDAVRSWSWGNKRYPAFADAEDLAQGIDNL